MTKRTLRLIQITDTHLMAEPSAVSWDHCNQANLDAVLTLARMLHFPADAVIATGDLVHDESEAGYLRLASQLAALGPPVFALPGNHDEPRRMARIFSETPLHYCGHHLLGDWQLALLDTHVDGTDAGEVRPAELEALEEALSRHPERPALVCLHHHPVPIGSRWMDSMRLANSDALLRIVDRQPQIRCLLWGHVHQSFDRYRGDVRLLATPATTRQFLPRSESFALDDRPPGYRWLDLHADGTVDTGIERLDTVPAG